MMPTHIVAVGGIVDDGQGNILLVETTHNGWVFPGGQVEVGENLLAALVREIKEESGIDVNVKTLIGVYSNTATHKWFDGVTDVPTKLLLDFRCTYVGGTLATSEETTASQWVAQADVLNWVTAPAIRTRYEAFLKESGDVQYMDYVTKPSFQLKLATTI